MLFVNNDVIPRLTALLKSYRYDLFGTASVSLVVCPAGEPAPAASALCAFCSFWLADRGFSAVCRCRIMHWLGQIATSFSQDTT